MALSKKDRQQLMGIAIFLGLGVPVGYWMQIHQPAAARIQVKQVELDSLTREVAAARAVLTRGTVEQLGQRVQVYERSLRLMRQLVPTQDEVTTLIDQVSTRAQLRGVQITEINPIRPNITEGPFEVVRYRISAVGTFDQLGEFLTDVASLPRIMVPSEVHLSPVANFSIVGGDPDQTYLQARFQLRAFAKAAGLAELGGSGGF